MTLNEYQQKAMSTCMDSCSNFSYMILNLVGEVGELASKVAKHVRKGQAFIDNNDLFFGDIPEDAIADPEAWKEEQDALLRAEAGDCMWQLAGLCHAMGWTLEDICRENLEKLASRKQRGVIDGSGDKR